MHLSELEDPQDGGSPPLSERLGYGVAYASALLLTLLLILAFLWPLSVITVQSGEAGVLYQRLFGGTVVDRVYGEGIHLILPWDTMTIYNVRVQARDHHFQVLTTKGLPINLYLTIRYYPEYDLVGLLHKLVGPDYVDKIIVPQIESVLRKTIGKHDPEVIYTNQHGVLDRIIVQALEEAGQKFVVVDEVIIRRVELPDPIRDAIAEKLVHEQKLQAYQFRLAAEQEEAKRKEIEAGGIRRYQEIITQSLTGDLLTWKGIQATEQISTSNNSKVVVIGAGERGLPVILGGQ
jgi:regulator of protease activity HflC (stomatin/prohibitin superfamily)